jgi:hypothetical protein
VSLVSSRALWLPPARTRRSRAPQAETASRPASVSFNRTRFLAYPGRRTRFVFTSLTQPGSSKVRDFTFTRTRRSLALLASLTLKP